MAKEAELAAVASLRAGHFRAAASRFYFAAYAAVHAVLLMHGNTPPDRGNWAHKGLPETLRASLGSGRNGSHYKQLLGDLYDMRILADYDPEMTMDAGAAQHSRRSGGAIIRLAERMASK